MHNNYDSAFSLSQNDYPFSRIKRFVSYTQAPSFNLQFSIFNCKTVLASCTTSVYVNLSKNSFFFAPNFGKRVQRYDFFSNHQNFSKKNFIFYAKILSLLMHIKTQNRLHLIIYIREKKRRRGEKVKEERRRERRKQTKGIIWQ